MIPPSICTRRSDGFWHERILLVTLIETSPIMITGGGRRCGAAAALGGGRRRREVCGEEGAACSSSRRLATSPHDPLGITDSAYKNQLVVVSIQYGPFNTHIPIRSTTIGKSRVAKDPIAMDTSWRSNSDITSITSIGYQRVKASGESSTAKHRLLHASGPHPIPPPNDPKLTSFPDAGEAAHGQADGTS
ncbi:hypothetical protein F511_22170 [Dorcoceras hygrometricum]|uniref:Uncharacterized protein n=1 Tax=Dorcoceras hygrometricum TaxID=472368 RepID=A0A2Z7C1S9_9LAMI|nr:hypothetical protein F511_22170 [Dorcoceras hygrometricum]